MLVRLRPSNRYGKSPCNIPAHVSSQPVYEGLSIDKYGSGSKRDPLFRFHQISEVDCLVNDGEPSSSEPLVNILTSFET